MKLVVTDEGAYYDADIVHRRVKVSTMSEGLEVFSRLVIVCAAAIATPEMARFTSAAVNCIACLAMEVRLKCRRGSCGKLTGPAQMCIHRDTLEAYCLACARRINYACQDRRLVQRQTE